MGDFDGDGRNDLLWRNQAAGANVVWYMNGGVVRQTEVIGSVGSTWTPVAVGDYDGDGRDDLIWKEAGGTVVQWLMKGYLNAPTVTVLGGVGAGWNVVGQQ